MNYRGAASGKAVVALKSAYGTTPRMNVLEGRMELVRLPSVMDVRGALAALRSEPEVGTRGAEFHPIQARADAAWNEKLMPVKFDFSRAQEVSALACARAYGAKVVNGGFGGPAYTRAQRDAIADLAANNILFRRSRLVGGWGTSPFALPALGAAGLLCRVVRQRREMSEVSQPFRTIRRPIFRSA